MRVGVDAQLARGTATGIGEYVRGLVPALRARTLDVAALDFAPLDPWRFDRRVVWDQVGLPLAAARSRVDVLHCAAGTMPLVASAPVVVTVHDVAWLRVQAHTRPYARAYFGAFMLARYRRAAGIIVDSHFSRAELLDVVPVDPALLSVVYPGVADDVMHVRRARDDDAPFILCVGTVEARKNLEILVRALPALPRLRLISVGPPTPYRDVCLRIAHDLGVANRFELRGYVARAALLDLYARALVAAVPSRYEGFGYAAAQALCAGTPLVTSNAASLPEVAPPGSVLLPPDDAGAWAAAIGAVASARDQADARAAALRASACERFAWSSAAKRAHEAYAAALLRQ